MERFRRMIYRTRGIYLLLSLVVVAWLKHRAGAGVGLPLFLGLLSVAVAAQCFRTWAAGFVGTRARSREVAAEVLLTAGPYAYVRNPMYLGNVVIMTALAGMSGLWYVFPLVWASYAFVYANVIPYEESYLSGRFGEEYDVYCRHVPRLFPARRHYPVPRGVFDIREGLANEIVAWPVMLIVAKALYVL